MNAGEALLRQLARVEAADKLGNWDIAMHMFDDEVDGPVSRKELWAAGRAAQLQLDLLKPAKTFLGATEKRARSGLA